MPNESPLGMMQSPGRRLRTSSAKPVRGPPLWPVLAPATILMTLALGWVWIWYYAGSVTNRTLAGWVEREAAAGRVYSCGSQSMDGFPFRLQARCTDAVADINNHQPQLTVSAKTLTFTAEIFDPMSLVGQITAPLTFAESGEPPGFIAEWSRAQVSVRGKPPDLEMLSIVLDGPRLNRAGVAGTVFTAKHAELQGRTVAGSARSNPVVETTLHVVAATAPTLHPLVAQPIEVELDVIVRGLKNLSPKPWADRFREIQAAGGAVDIKSLRVARADAIVVGSGKLTINGQGKLDGLIQVAIAGIDHLVPLMGFDRFLGQGIDRLSGVTGASTPGLGALDRVVPGLGEAVRDTANASLIDNIRKMGKPTELEKQPAIVLPLRFSDGSIYLGLLPLGQVPALF